MSTETNHRELRNSVAGRYAERFQPQAQSTAAVPFVTSYASTFGQTPE